MSEAFYTTRVIDLSNPCYPYLLKNIKDPPKKIFYKGNYSQSIFNRCVAVVGSRSMSMYGKKATRSLIASLCGFGISVVSGFMYGVDETAHSSCLEFGGKTIAVMPCGIETIHPGRQKELYRRILESGGLVISEFEGIFPPCAWTYPRRNRIVAGLSQAVLVVEAGKESGSLITANCSRQNNRMVLAVPGPINSPTSEGTNRLIKEGAEMVCSGQDLINIFVNKLGFKATNLGSDFRECNTKNPAVSEYAIRVDSPNSLNTRILKLLEKEALDVNSISNMLKADSSLISVELTVLSLNGLICEKEGLYYVS